MEPPPHGARSRLSRPQETGQSPVLLFVIMGVLILLALAMKMTEDKPAASPQDGIPAAPSSFPAPT